MSQIPRITKLVTKIFKNMRDASAPRSKARVGNQIPSEWLAELETAMSLNDFAKALELLDQAIPKAHNWKPDVRAKIYYEMGRFGDSISIINGINDNKLQARLYSNQLRANRQLSANEGITVVLRGIKGRPEDPRQLAAIRSQSLQPTEIRFWNVPSAKHGREADDSDGMYGMLADALFCKGKYVAVVDKGALPNVRWLENCRDFIRRSPAILGADGAIARRPGESARIENLIGEVSNPTEVDFLSGTWFFERRCLQYVWAEEPASWTEGAALHLSYTAQKYGRLKSIVLPRKIQTGLSFVDKPLRYLEASQHELVKQRRDELLKHIEGRGWQTVASRETQVAVSPTIEVFIPTFNRQTSLSRLLHRLNEEAIGYSVVVNVYDDGSAVPVELDWDAYPNLSGLHLSRSHNHGKKRYWRLVDKIFRSARTSKADYYYYLADDVDLVPNFFGESIKQWTAILDDYKVAMNLILDQRGGKKNWTNYQAHIVQTEAAPVYRCQWVDMVMMFNRQLLETIDFRVEPVSLKRWDKDPNLSSGVGQQLSHKLHRMYCSMYQVTNSLVLHGDAPSMMNPEERLRTPIISVVASQPE